MGHHHHHHNNISGRKIGVAVILNFIITAVQVVGGLMSHSLSLLSDALHNLSDGLALVISYIAERISQRDSNENKTFGYKRAGIIAALFNSAVLIVISLYLFIEAYHRWMNPQEIKGWLMFSVAVVGLIANLVSMLLLKKDSHSNINIKAAYLHLLGDTLSSVGVIIGAILIIYFNLFIIDAIITIGIGLYIIWESVRILRESINILMQATPEGLSLSDVRTHIESYNEIKNIHHIHAWNLNDQRIHFECHIQLIDDLHVSDTNLLQQRLSKELSTIFHIQHTTLQFEFNNCNEGGLMC